MSGLFSAEDVAAAANLEVFRGDAESGAEVGELLNGGEAFAGIAGENAIARNQQIAEGQSIAAADAAAQLVELGEAEALGVINQYRIAGWYIDTVFNNRCGEQ